MGKKAGKNLTGTILQISLGLIIVVMISSIVIKSVAPAKSDPDKIMLDSLSIENKIKVSVLNGCGESGVAARTQKYLEDLNFDVVEIANYKGDMPVTIIFDRTGNPDAARKLSSSIGAGPESVVPAPDSSLFVDLCVIIGDDYKKLKQFN